MPPSPSIHLPLPLPLPICFFFRHFRLPILILCNGLISFILILAFPRISTPITLTTLNINALCVFAVFYPSCLFLRLFRTFIHRFSGVLTLSAFILTLILPDPYSTYTALLYVTFASLTFISSLFHFVLRRFYPSQALHRKREFLRKLKAVTPLVPITSTPRSPLLDLLAQQHQPSHPLNLPLDLQEIDGTRPITYHDHDTGGYFDSREFATVNHITLDLYKASLSAQLFVYAPPKLITHDIWAHMWLGKVGRN